MALPSQASATPWNQPRPAHSTNFGPGSEQAWPPLSLFKALLLAVWYNRSDVKLAEAIEDRASLRRFCGFASDEPTPERAAFVRFRRELLARSLDRVLFEAVTHQLDAQGVIVRTGTLVDATLIASASIRTDNEARWAGHRRKKPVHGYQAHVTTDEAAGLVRSVEVTTANTHDGTMLEVLLPQDPGEVYGDSAYSAGRFTDVIRARGGKARVVYTHTWGGPEALARLEAWNASVRAVRCRIEKVFGTWKRSYGLRRMRWLGLAKAGLQVRLTVTAYNLRRTMMLVRAQPA